MPALNACTSANAQSGGSGDDRRPLFQPLAGRLRKPIRREDGQRYNLPDGRNPVVTRHPTEPQQSVKTMMR
jgi:hypothetical protein